MTTLAEFMIIVGVDNRPPMLEKSLYDSWKSRMEIYMENRENRRMILDSVQNGPLVWPTIIEENRTTRKKTYAELSAFEKLQDDCDCKATNIVLQGLALPVFNQGDDPIACLNKAMAFLTVVASTGYKGNATSFGGNNAGGQERVVKCYNYQGEVHVARQCTQSNMARNVAWFKEKAMLAEAQEAGQILDEEQLAFLADPGIPDGQTAQTTIPNTAAFQTEDLDAYDSDCDDVSNAKAVLMANLSNYGYDIISEVPHSDSYHNDMDNQSVHAMQDFEQTPVVDFSNNEIHSDSNIISYSQYLQEMQQAAVQDTNVYAQQDSMILSVIEQMSDQMINHVNNWKKANQENNNESLIAELERYKEREKFALKQQIDSLKQNLSNQIKEKESLLRTFTVFKNESKEKESKYMDKEIDLEKKIKELDNIVYKVGQSAQTVHMLTKPQVFYDDTHKQALGYQNPFYLKKAQRIKPTLYDGSVISSQHVASPVFDDEETLILEEVSRSKMLAKQNDPISKEKKVNTTPINYAELNRLSEDFGKRFVPQQELSDEQAFWLQTSHPNTDQSASSPVKIEAPRELPKVSLVNTSLKKLKYHLGQFDTVVKKQITPDAITEGEWGFEHTKTVFLNEIIPFLKTLKDIFNVFDKDLLNEEHIKSMSENDKEEKVKYEMDEIKTINIELEHNLKCQIQDKVFVITSLKNDLRKLKGKEVGNTTQIPITTTISPGMFKLDLDPLAPRLLQNREAHIYYLKHTQEQANILRGIVQQAKVKQPLDNALDLAFKHAKRIQELLVYVQDTCPNTIKPSEKNVGITPMNKVKKVRFSEPLTSSSNIKQVESSKTSDSNTHVLSSTRLKCSTSSCRSQPTCNKNNDRISQKPSSNRKNKVEAQPKKVNKKNRAKEPICDDNVKHTMLNANSLLICVKCKQCMFDANHDVCFLDFVSGVNMRAKSTSKSKKNQVHNNWKPTSKVFTEVGLKWKPIGRFFTIVGNSCPLTRITPTKVVHPKETTFNSVETSKPELKVHSKRPKQLKSVGSSKKAKIIQSKIANNSEPTHLWGSNATDVPSSSSFVNDRLSRLFSGSRDTNLYTISLDDMLKTSPICLLSKASKTKSWLWHRRLSHLNFGTLNKLAKDGLARGISKLKFQKDHLCSACALGKSKKSSHQPKVEDTNQEKLYLLHMDLCGPISVESINRK
ncbi:retrovirus-related pol polyprotein from transposon TNT 1-94 [Tanacetum coccineum]